MYPRLLNSLDLQAFTEAARNVPYQQLKAGFFPDLDVWVRRDDLIDPLISGNKAYKLIFNLLDARDKGAKTIITCGGAWSNHIHAIAAAGSRFGFKTIGIVRGERPAKLSATLQDAERFGMQLMFVTRSLYRQRGKEDFLRQVGLELDAAYFVPEGGANLAGVRGIQLLGQVIEETAPVDFDQVWVACGTGATFAGLYSSISSAPVIGVEVLKAGDSTLEQVRRWLGSIYLSSCKGGGDKQVKHQFQLASIDEFLLGGHHFGGYGKYPGELRGFQEFFEVSINTPLDPIYTVKLMAALAKNDDYFGSPYKCRVLIVHSGGLQGRRGYDLSCL
ncbi:1-aminocyclopropane-1-carboxylate deaminase/D-cysteine desulfhydrase [Microbulbifer echini]|uniref:1-aminocyclopropane-1-carboxylate deaminase/D-cysteine desulfhydrase n=1 Tax=Microbulbifer echini TaxID=1529067 RepID=A0ABV4NRB7_9GAMM